MDPCSDPARNSLRNDGRASIDPSARINGPYGVSGLKTLVNKGCAAALGRRGGPRNGETGLEKEAQGKGCRTDRPAPGTGKQA